MTAGEFIRIDNALIRANNIEIITADLKSKTLRIQSKGENGYNFENDTEEQTQAVFLDIWKILQTHYKEISFLFFYNKIIHLDLISGIEVVSVFKPQITITLADGNSERFTYETPEAANKVFEELLVSFGIIKGE